MKLRYIMGAAALSLILTGTAHPQQEQEKDKPQQQEQKPAEKQKPAEQPKQKPAEQPKTQQRQEQSAKQQPQEQKKEQEKQSEQANRQHQEQQKQVTKQQQEDQKQQQRTQQQVAKQQRVDDHQNVQQNDQRSNGHGRIPDDRFRASFGREHHFHVGHVDNRRFQYGGYWFTYSEAWPGGWGYSDNFYIDFINGQYYLIDLSHPGVQLLLVVD